MFIAFTNSDSLNDVQHNVHTLNEFFNKYGKFSLENPFLLIFNEQFIFSAKLPYNFKESSAIIAYDCFNEVDFNEQHSVYGDIKKILEIEMSPNSLLIHHTHQHTTLLNLINAQTNRNLIVHQGMHIAGDRYYTVVINVISNIK
jgi:hypothetical protein